MEHLLKQLGLTDHEVSVYKALLEEGASLAGRITRKTGIHRRNVYDCLERLIQKGLVGYIQKNNTKEYSVKNPQLILENIKQQEEEWQELMPTLLAKYESKEKNETIFYRGKKSIQLVFEDQLNKGKEILVHATSKEIEEELKYFFPKYHRSRIKKKIKYKMLFDSQYKGKVTDFDETKIKYLPNFNSTNVSQYIYDNTVAIIAWHEEPIAIMIREPVIVQSYRERFEVMWKLAK